MLNVKFVLVVISVCTFLNSLNLWDSFKKLLNINGRTLRKLFHKVYYLWKWPLAPPDFFSALYWDERTDLEAGHVGGRHDKGKILSIIANAGASPDWWMVWPSVTVWAGKNIWVKMRFKFGKKMFYKLFRLCWYQFLICKTRKLGFFVFKILSITKIMIQGAPG